MERKCCQATNTINKNVIIEEYKGAFNNPKAFYIMTDEQYEQPKDFSLLRKYYGFSDDKLLQDFESNIYK